MYHNTICLICDTNANTRIKFKQNFSPEMLNPEIFSARRTTEHYHYNLLECTKCSLVFSSPILPLEEISKLYKDSLQNYDKETDDISYSYMQYILENKNLFKKDRALEIGCGNGFFLQRLNEFGYKEVFGVEPSVEAVSKSGALKANIFNGIIENADYEKNFFDLICCFQTLDHLVNPLEITNLVYDLLVPGGIAYFIVHNENSLQAKLFGENSPIYDVEHIYLFNKKTLPLFAEKADFKIVKVFDVKNTYPLSYWVRMAPLPFKSQISSIIKLLRLSDIKVSIYPGNIGIFIQKPLETAAAH